MNVPIISFSGRAGGNCDGISQVIAGRYQNSTIFRFSEEQIHPCGICRYECFGRGTVCPYLDDPEYTLIETICRSDLVYFVIPNYCDYPCANYFIFIERSQCYFQGKPEQLEAFLRIPKNSLSSAIPIRRISVRFLGKTWKMIQKFCFYVPKNTVKSAFSGI